MMCVRRYSSLWLTGLFLFSLLSGCGVRQTAGRRESAARACDLGAGFAVGFARVDGVGRHTTPLPDRVARISASVEGRVVDVLKDKNGKPVIEGQVVEPGTILVQLRPHARRRQFGQGNSGPECSEAGRRASQDC